MEHLRGNRSPPPVQWCLLEDTGKLGPSKANNRRNSLIQEVVSVLFLAFLSYLVDSQKSVMTASE